MARTHLYTTVTDRDGGPWPWASIRVYASDGVAPFAGPIWTDAKSSAQLPNPFVVAPGIVDCYFDGPVQVVLGVTSLDDVERLSPPLDVPSIPETSVFASSSTLIVGEPFGGAALRYKDGAVTWYSPRLGDHDHHGSAPDTLQVGPRDNFARSAISFSDATLIGVRSHGLPGYLWTYEALTARYQIYSRIQGIPYSVLSGPFIPGASTDLREITAIGSDAVARGRGNVAIGQSAYAADDAYAGSDPGGVVVGVDAVSRNGAIALGRQACGPLSPRVSSGLSDRVVLGSHAMEPGARATVLGSFADSDEDGVAIGYANSAPASGVEINSLNANPLAILLSGKESVVPGGLWAQRNFVAGPCSFFGANIGTQLSAAPSGAPMEPASGIGALDNLIYALRDLGMVAPGETSGSAAPKSWLPDAVTALGNYQDSLDSTSVRLTCDNPGASGVFTGRVLGTPMDLDYLPLLSMGAGSAVRDDGPVTGRYDVGLADPGAYRVSLHSLASPTETPTLANRVGLFRLNNPSSPPAMPPVFERPRGGTWNSASVRVSAGRYKRAVLTDASGTPVSYRDSEAISAYAAEVVLTSGSSVLARASLGINGYALPLPNGPVAGFDIELRTFSGTTIGRLRRAVSPLPVGTLGLMCLALCREEKSAYRAREILLALTAVQQNDGTLPQTPAGLVDYGWIGLAALAYARTTGSAEFATFLQRVSTKIKSTQGGDGALVEGGTASTSANALCWRVLARTDPVAAANLSSALTTRHLLASGYFARSVNATTHTPDTTSSARAAMLGALFLYSTGNVAGARKALRSLSGHRVRRQVQDDGSTVSGYSTAANPPGAFDPELTAMGSCIGETIGNGNDNESVQAWWIANAPTTNYSVLSWIALLGSGTSLD